MGNMLDALSVVDRIDLDVVRATQKKITAFHALIQTLLTPKVDYGVIPGTPKPTLLKPGAEKIAMELGLSPNYTILDKTLDLQSGFIRYEIMCSLHHNGELVAQAIGSCSTFESKYRYTWVRAEEATAAGIDIANCASKKDNYGTVKVRVTRIDMMDMDNTVLKMSQKRAFVGAVLHVAALSNMFEQDLEDISEVLASEHAETASKDEAGNYVVRFGTKHKGKTISAIGKEDRGYVQWLADKATDAAVMAVAKKWLAENPTTASEKPAASANVATPKPPSAPRQAPSQDEPPMPDDDQAPLPFDL
jgi:hypothetical protein